MPVRVIADGNKIGWDLVEKAPFGKRSCRLLATEELYQLIERQRETISQLSETAMTIRIPLSNVGAN